MKNCVAIVSLMVLAVSVLADDLSPKEQVVSAAQKLAMQDNYTWTQSVSYGDTDSITEGKVDRGGFTYITWNIGDNAAEGLLKGTNGVFRTEGDWQTVAEGLKAIQAMKDGDYNGPPVWPARMLETFVAPPAEAEKLAAETKDLKLKDGVYAGELSEEGVKRVLLNGRTRPEIIFKSTKGSVKFWVNDGVLAKYEYKVEGSMTLKGEDHDIDERTFTVAIKNLGTTKVPAPEGGKKKLS